MKRIILTGYNGFIGSNLRRSMVDYDIINWKFYNKADNYKESTIINLAGKAHDLKTLPPRQILPGQY